MQKSSEQYEQRVWSRPSKESDQTDSPNIAGSTESTSLASDAVVYANAAISQKISIASDSSQDYQNAVIRGFLWNLEFF